MPGSPARSWMARLFGPASATRRSPPALEALEGRETPAAFIAPGDVRALIAAITRADASVGTNVIDLAPGSVYTLTAVDNWWYGPNGLPAISAPAGGSLIINGHGA